MLVTARGDVQLGNSGQPIEIDPKRQGDFYLLADQASPRSSRPPPCDEKREYKGHEAAL